MSPHRRLTIECNVKEQSRVIRGQLRLCRKPSPLSRMQDTKKCFPWEIDKYLDVCPAFIKLYYCNLPWRFQFQRFGKQ